MEHCLSQPYQNEEAAPGVERLGIGGDENQDGLWAILAGLAPRKLYVQVVNGYPAFDEGTIRLAENIG